MNKLVKLLIVLCCISLLATNVYAVDSSEATNDEIYTNINQGFTKPTKEQIKEEQEKFKKAEKYVKEKREKLKKAKGDIEIAAAGGVKVNAVGTFRQALSYTCGPAAARNLIKGYVDTNSWDPNFKATVPTESTLRKDLGTTTAGTNFDATKWQNTLNKYVPENGYLLSWGTSSGWESTLASRVIYTIDYVYYITWGYGRSGFNVIGNINHGSTTTPIHDHYKNGAAHYICIYGYDDINKMYYISDSNSAVPVTYKASYRNTANSTQARGIVW